MNASCLPSGDQVTSLPVPGSGLLVPVIDARKVTSVPSDRATNNPPFSPWWPRKANHLPSGDHSGPPPESFSPPTRTDFCAGTSMIQSCPYGRPGRSHMVTVYAIRRPSGDSSTLPTERKRESSLLLSPCASPEG